MRKTLRVLLAAAASLSLVQCGEDVKVVTTSKEGKRVTLQPSGFFAAPPGSVYEGWLVDSAGTYHSFGKFNWNNYLYSFVSPSGSWLGLQFNTGRNVFAAESVVFSIEPASDPAPASPSIILFRGAVASNGSFEVSFPQNYKLPSVEANYFLATPSDTLYRLEAEYNSPNLTAQQKDAHRLNEARGVWFGNIDAFFGEIDTFFIVPPIPAGWQYEGWLTKGSVRVSLGRFTRGDTSDFSNIYQDPNRPIFTLPGEDFLVNSPSGIDLLTRSEVMVTLEPNPDTDLQNPYGLVLFRGTTPDTTLSAGVLQIQADRVFDNRSRFFPKITVQIIPD